MAPEDVVSRAGASFTSRFAASGAQGGQAIEHRGPYQRIWPHEDGRGWAYRLTTRDWGFSIPFVYSSPELAPVLSLDQAASLLANRPEDGGAEILTGIYRLRFDGSITTLSGVTAQYLRELVEAPGAAGAALTAASAARALPSSVAGGPGAGFMRALFRARPDIAKRLGASVAPQIQSQPAGLPFQPALLHGYAWEQSSQWIGTYGDLNRQIAWIYLTPNLHPGAEFTLQLVPDLANDVFLHARVLGRKEILTEAGTFHRALEVLYLVDFGLSQVTDVDGNTIGYIRPYLFGTVSYAVGVGPVSSYERFVFSAGEPLKAQGYDATSILIETGSGEGGDLDVSGRDEGRDHHGSREDTVRRD